MVQGWHLAEAPKITVGGETISSSGYSDKNWYPAVVPGTALRTLIARGVYPDPTIGLNNLAIPERLNKQDYWYRTEFDAPKGALKKAVTITFNGINYASEIWLNGQKLGTTRGAFIRGTFDLTGRLKGHNALAVKVSPPPHPGIAHEESIATGAGPNGGEMVTDGPTFMATEGWDWIPSIRDRNTGLWQNVVLDVKGPLTLGDARFVTRLPKSDNSEAAITIQVPVTNRGNRSIQAKIEVAFDGVKVRKSVSLSAHSTTVTTFTPTEFPSLVVVKPKLWWPNGYGEASLHRAQITVASGAEISDRQSVKFGMREVRYEMALIDQSGDLNRYLVDPTAAGSQVIDVRHNHIRRVVDDAQWGGYVYSLADKAKLGKGLSLIGPDDGVNPRFVIQVNGVRIAARGGNVGMNDLMKRGERARQEPFFRLERDAHVNVIRNWGGQNTEETFFDLADEYGIMVLSDFWAQTQDHNSDPTDSALFLQNAADVVPRFRNHPSIVLWLGRNEGVPQAPINEGLEKIIRETDGTRLYMSSSNDVNLHSSGPYNWREPSLYFTDLAPGFAVEIGAPSFPTLESWKRAIPEKDIWPISDTWAYHDWHSNQIQTVTAALNERFGEAEDIVDFERKVQMLQYEGYRAIFEGMNAGLWARNSGRMLWMVQPAWPSSFWQLMSSDYDTAGAYYGFQKAAEPVHVQMNLPDYNLMVINNTSRPLDKTSLVATVSGLDGTVISQTRKVVEAPASAATEVFKLDLGKFMADGPVLVRLELYDAAGKMLSDNFYWQAAEPKALQAMSKMAPVALSGTAVLRHLGAEDEVTVTLKNATQMPALATKLTLFTGEGTQVLPAYFSGNYVSLLPGEQRQVSIRMPAGKVPAKVTLRGWNIVISELKIDAAP